MTPRTAKARKRRHFENGESSAPTVDVNSPRHWTSIRVDARSYHNDPWLRWVGTPIPGIVGESIPSPGSLAPATAPCPWPPACQSDTRWRHCAGLLGRPCACQILSKSNGLLLRYQNGYSAPAERLRYLSACSTIHLMTGCFDGILDPM